MNTQWGGPWHSQNTGVLKINTGGLPPFSAAMAICWIYHTRKSQHCLSRLVGSALPKKKHPSVFTPVGGWGVVLMAGHPFYPRGHFSTFRFQMWEVRRRLRQRHARFSRWDGRQGSFKSIRPRLTLTLSYTCDSSHMHLYERGCCCLVLWF